MRCTLLVVPLMAGLLGGGEAAAQEPDDQRKAESERCECPAAQRLPRGLRLRHLLGSQLNDVRHRLRIAPRIRIQTGHDRGPHQEGDGHRAGEPIWLPRIDFDGLHDLDRLRLVPRIRIQTHPSGRYRST